MLKNTVLEVKLYNKANGKLKIQKKSVNSLIRKCITLFENLFIKHYFLTASDFTTGKANTKLFSQKDLKVSRSVCAILDLV